VYDQVIQPTAVISDWFVFGYAAKWLFDSEIYSDVLTPKEAIDRNDKRVVGKIWDLLNKADIIVGHNSNRFDIKKLNTRFLLHNISPPLPYRSIDTLKVIKENFSFSSNKLDYVNGFLGLGQKTEVDFQLWKECFYGNESSLKTMLKYNENDVFILEELYLKVRPWIKAHPNLGLYIDTDEIVCKNCGNSNLTWKGYYMTPLGKYRGFTCDNCGAIGRSSHNELSPQKRKSLAR
jgi:DNA polymerase elongation subunit (family B)